MELPFDLDAEVVRLIRAKVIELPTYPGIALQLQRVINNGSFGVDDLVKLVEADPGLASHVIRAANSAFYRPIQPITTLGSAILRIGASELSNIAIAGTLGVEALIEGPLGPLRRDSWRRSVVSGLLAQELAKGRGLDAGEAFLAGLLHDFGQTIAYRTFEVILEHHKNVSARPYEVWERRANAYHVELGMTLAADWKLPEFLCDVVARHHDANPTAENSKLLELIVACDTVNARLFGAASLEEAHLEAVAGLSPTEEAALAKLVPRLPSLLESLDVPSPDKPPNPIIAQPTPPPAPPPVLALNVTIVRNRQRESFQAHAFTESTVQVSGRSAVPLRQLVNVEIEDFAFAATVTACNAVNDAYRLELKPFALDAKGSARWKEIRTTASRAAQAA